MPVELPEPDRTILSRSPLDLVVCQVRYDMSPAVSEARIALAFHQAIGGKDGDFPDIQQIGAGSLQVTTAVSEGAPLTQTRSLGAGWRFVSSDGTWAVVLTHDFCSLETSRYPSWGVFRERLFRVIDAVATHVEPRFEQRVGARYVDRIRQPDISAPHQWRPFLANELLGLLQNDVLGPAVVAGQQQWLLTLREDVTCGFRHGFLQDPATPRQLDYLLDYDISRAGGRAFDADAIKHVVDDFNHYALQLFQASITPQLMETLR
jgi:uncharacterized protein (TIGR04255 family)